MFVTPEQEKQENFLKQDGVQLEVVEKDPVVEWFALNYKQWGANLQFVTNKSQEGTWFYTQCFCEDNTNLALVV